MIELGVNIDHVATLRQARRGSEPDVLMAAQEAEAGGADGITIHLREDRRHIQDADVKGLRKSVRTRLNLELSLHEEIVLIAMDVKPDQATLVPEHRQEITTEGGLDLISQKQRVADVVRRLKDANIVTSAFIEPDADQVRQAVESGFDAVELHTGAYANAKAAALDREALRLVEAGALAVRLGLRLHAGHGLNYTNTPTIARIPHMRELNIGHAIVSRAMFVGLKTAVAQMKSLIESADTID